MLTVELPYLTGGGGGNLRQYHLIRELSRRHEIWLVSGALPWEAERVEEVARYCGRTLVVPHRFRFRPAKRRWHYWLNRLTYLSSPFPFEVERYEHLRGHFHLRVRALLEEQMPDVVQIEHSNLAHWDGLVPPGVPRVLTMHDVLSDVARLKSGLEGPWREKLLDRVEWLKTRRYEKRYLAHYDLLVATSDADRLLAHRLAPGARLSVVPNGVDTAYFTPTDAETEGDSIVFTGSMNHPPNEDGVLCFCRETYPRIRARWPGAKLYVVGRSPSERVQLLHGHDGVVVTGEVADVRPYLNRAAVVVAPLRYGGGTRLKILEALASGRAVVSTSIGAAGLDLADGEELVLADGPEAFADAVVGLLGDPDRRRRLGRRGRSSVEIRYDWGPVAARLDESYRELVGSRA